MIRSLTTFAISASLLASVSACSDSGPVDAPTAARTGASVVHNASEPAYVGGLFTGSASTGGSVMAQIQANLGLVFTLPTCTAMSNLQLGGANGEGGGSLDVSFDHCTDGSGQLLLDGALHAAITVTQSPLTLTASLETDGLTVGDHTISGSWEVHHVVGDAPSTWSGDLTVTGPDGTLTSSSDASFQVDGLCVTYSLDAKVATSSGNDLHVKADQVKSCLGACPISGSVTVDGSAEGSLSWSYDGSHSVTVSGSAQGSFQLDLSCQ